MTTPNTSRSSRTRGQRYEGFVDSLELFVGALAHTSTISYLLPTYGGPETSFDSHYPRPYYPIGPLDRGGSSYAERTALPEQPWYLHAASTPYLSLSIWPEPDYDARGSMTRSNSIPSRTRTSRRGGHRSRQQPQPTQPASGARASSTALMPRAVELSTNPRRTSRQTTGPLTIFEEKVLGRGSQGTVVLEGIFRGRAVAVKRVLRDYYTVAAREVEILRESDHPNVIQYFHQEARDNFLYIALERCQATLADVVERPSLFSSVASTFNAKRALREITSGLDHLHELQIIHRDIKPQNILISYETEDTGHRMLLSDFGLCKKLEADETSYEASEAASGTIGWRAPEVLRGDVRISEGAETMPGGVTPTGRLRKSVDIFPLGCLFYYVLTSGMHPFGERLRRDGNISDDMKSLEGLDQLRKDGERAKDLIIRMLNPEARDRPDTATCLQDVYFQSSRRRVTFPG